MDRYVMKYSDSKYVALDAQSGGYPYPVDNIFHAKIWPSAEDAARYRAVGKNDFTIHKIVQIIVEPVKETTDIVSVTKFTDPS